MFDLNQRLLLVPGMIFLIWFGDLFGLVIFGLVTTPGGACVGAPRGPRQIIAE